MQCDRVFMVLTQGPFPTGDPDDQAVEDHLLSCDSCRRIAMALQPRIELFDEAIASGEKESLPAYWGRLIEAEEEPVDDEPVVEEQPSASEQTSIEIARSGGARFNRSRLPRASRAYRNEPKSRWPLAGAFVVGIVFCLTSVEWLASTARWGDGTTVGTETSTGKSTLPGRTELAGITPLADPTICPRPNLQAEDDAVVGEKTADTQAPQEITPASQEKECCTKCHHADAPSTLTSTQMVQVVQTCSECH